MLLTTNILWRCGRYPFRMLDKPHDNRPARVGSLKQESHFSADLALSHSHCGTGWHRPTSRISRKIDQGFSHIVETDECANKHPVKSVALRRFPDICR